MKALYYILGAMLIYVGGYTNGQSDITKSDSYSDMKEGAVQYRTKIVEVPTLPDICESALTFAQETNLGSNNQSFEFANRATACYQELGINKDNAHREVVKAEAFNRFNNLGSDTTYSEEEIDAAFSECEEDGYDDIDYCDEILDDYLS